MKGWSLAFDVLIFELRRSFTALRMGLWFVLTAFPIAVVIAMLAIAKLELGDRYNPERLVEPFGMAMYFLIPELACLLGLLLWAAPAVSTEIEGQTWVYLATRQAGRTAVIFGKYLTAVVWSLSAALVSLAICCLAAGPTIGGQLWAVLLVLSVVSCLVHAALYVLIGTWFYKRTMVTAVVYTIIVEYVVSFIPAVVNQFTINYRLRGILARWMGWEDALTNAQNVFGNEPITTHLAVLALMVAVFLAAAVYRVERAEYPTQQNT